MKLEIENGVLKKIHMIYFGDDAFSECDNLKRITLPSREFELNPKAFDRGSNYIINYKED